VAGPADRDLLVTWHEEFGREIGEAPGNVGEAVADRIGHGA